MSAAPRPGHAVFRLYGSDYPWTSLQMVQEDVAFLACIGLDDRGVPLVLGGNLGRLWEEAG